MTFASPSERRIRSEVPAPQLPAFSALASRGIHSMVSPPPTWPVRVHSRWRFRHLRPAGCRSGRLVPSPWFRTTPTAFSANGFRACCIPVPEGVRSVSTTVGHSSSARRQVPPDKSGGRWKSGRSGVSPTAPSHPSKKSPLQQPCHIAVVVAPSSSCLRVGHRFQCRVRRPSTSRLCSAVGSVATVAVASEQSPSPSMGFVPLQGSLAGTRSSPRCVSTSARTSLVPSIDSDVAIVSDRPASPVRPTVGVANVVCRAIPSSGSSTAVASRGHRPEVCPKRSLGDPSDAPSAEASGGSVRGRGPSWGF
jgi:hypothetical protein